MRSAERTRPPVLTIADDAPASPASSATEDVNCVLKFARDFVGSFTARDVADRSGIDIFTVRKVLHEGFTNGTLARRCGGDVVVRYGFAVNQPDHEEYA